MKDGQAICKVRERTSLNRVVILKALTYLKKKCNGYRIIFRVNLNCSFSKLLFKCLPKPPSLCVS